MEILDILFYLLIAIVAFLYAAVGHGGASGYLALMAIFGFAVNDMKSTALVLNLFVSASSFWFFFKNKYFDFDLTWPFLFTSIPAAFFGAYLPVNPNLYKIILGIFLFIAAIRFFVKPFEKEEVTKPQNILLSLFFGLVIGFFSGMIGIGGGIILSPLILLLGWGGMKKTAATSALFIFLNSASGLSGYFVSGFSLASNWYFMILIAFLAGLAGSYFGSKVVQTKPLTYILALVLLFAGFKLILI